MSPVALTLNITLGVLLVGAMILGLRLDRRLRALRESHKSFAKAVSELDQAALRTQSGLNELKATAEGVRADLSEQLHNARILSDRLIKLTSEADAQAQALAKAQADAQAQVLAQGKTRPEVAAKSLTDRPAHPRRIAEPAAAPRPGLAPRSRAIVDDDLFETAQSGKSRLGLSAVLGGRR
jgi:hypothetical protein